MPPPLGPARRHLAKVAAVPSKSGRKPASGRGLTIGSGPGSTLASSRSAVRRASATLESIGFGEPLVGNIAIRRILDPAEVICNRISDVVAHAHRAGVVMSRPEVVAPVLESCQG